MKESIALSRFLAGLQAGMAGALVMLAWMAVSMLWARHSIWWFPNLIATTFGGDPALRSGFGRYSAAGIALHLVQYSLLGGLFALALPDRLPVTRVLLLAVIFSLGLYYVMYHFVWKHVNPLIPLYSPDRQILVAHIFYGFLLARIPAYRKARAALNE
jgi:hypothetical protein